MYNKKVYIAEDQLIVALDIQKTLKRICCDEILMFRDIQSLFKTALSVPPDLIITELEINENSNFRKSVETLTANQHTQFLLLSSYSPEDIQGDYQIPGCTILSKPYSSDELIKCLVKILNLPGSDRQLENRQFTDFNN